MNDPRNPPPHPPAPPAFDVVEENPTGKYEWTRAEIESANCSLVDLADVFQRCSEAANYPLKNVRLRLVTRWGTATHVLKGDPLPLDVTKEEIAMTYGCSPPDASTPSNKCYQLEVIGLNPRTGGYGARISATRSGTFVITPDEAPYRVWELADGAARSPPGAEMKRHMQERMKLDGKDARTGREWVPPTAQRAPAYGGDPRGRFPSQYRGPQDGDGLDGLDGLDGQDDGLDGQDGQDGLDGQDDGSAYAGTARGAMPPQFRPRPGGGLGGTGYATAPGYPPQQPPYGAPGYQPPGYPPQQPPYGAPGYQPPGYPPQQPPYGAPGYQPPGVGSTGPNGEDLYVPGTGWINSPARTAQLQREQEAREVQKSQMEMFAKMQAQFEERMARMEQERLAAEARAERLRQEEKAERLRQEADRVERERAEKDRLERERMNEAHKAEMAELRRSFEEAQRRADERLTAALAQASQPQLREKTSDMITAVLGAAAPIVAGFKESRDMERSENQRRFDAQQAEALRRHDREMAAEAARAAAEREDRKAAFQFQMQMLTNRPQVDPTVADLKEQLREQRRTLDAALARQAREQSASSKDAVMAEIDRMMALRKRLGLDDGAGSDDPPVDPTIAGLTAIVKEASPAVQPLLTGLMTQWEQSNARAERREIREEERAARERENGRKGGMLEQPDGSLVPAKRATLSNGTMVDIPDDHVMLSDGSACIPVAQYPKHVAERTRVALENQQRYTPAAFLPPPTPQYVPPQYVPPQYVPPQFPYDAPQALPPPDPLAPAPMPLQSAPSNAPIHERHPTQLSLSLAESTDDAQPRHATPVLEDPATPALSPSAASVPKAAPSIASLREKLAARKAARYAPEAPAPDAAPASDETPSNEGDTNPTS